MDDELMHYGTPRHSGRYPWGSGDNPYQRNADFSKSYKELKGKGLSENDIAAAMGITTTLLRQKISMAHDQEMQGNINRANRLLDKYNSPTKVAQIMGVNESTIRSWRAAGQKQKRDVTKETADFLKSKVDEKGPIDIGAGVEFELGITRTRLDTALEMLQERGYTVHNVRVPQVNSPGNYTTVKVLAPSDVTTKEIGANKDMIHTLVDYHSDGDDTFKLTQYPSSIDSKRIFVKYAEDGGTEKDGVIELRRNVQDLDLGKSNYAQVRIAVDGVAYCKGMALYSDDIPDGFDIVVNSNKPKGTPLYGNKVDKDKNVLKAIKNNEELPFGAKIKAGGQSYYENESGEFIKSAGEFIKDDGSHKGEPHYSLSAVNKVNEEGDWDRWSKSLSSQFLSKQPLGLIQRQLNLAYSERADDFDEIMSLENAAVKQTLLESFASNCDSAAVDLKAAALPRQQSHVILPLDIPDTEVYAPNYKDGEHVCLIRYPHAGTFEIPELVVNNHNPKAKSILGTNPSDAIGISPKTAEKLSGADFDGDTVLVIPTNSKVRIKTMETPDALKNFDPKVAYPKHPGMELLTKEGKGREMGKVSNLITDMTLKGANIDEIVMAVKHSMVIIDAEKHELDWRQSEIDNHIPELKKKWQGRENAGASTLISKASSDARIPEREIARYDDDGTSHKSWKPNPETGAWEYRDTGRTYYSLKKKKDPETGKRVPVLDEDGNKVYVEKKAQTKTTKMFAVQDANELSSGTAVEAQYADYANKLKALANRARKEALSIKPVDVNKTAAKEYEQEVNSLNAKLLEAYKNAPKERQAQIVAKVKVDALKRDNPDMDNEDLKKHAQQALATARARLGANKSKVQVQITEREWQAIQSNAISTNKLKSILKNTDLDAVRKYATPRDSLKISSSKVARIKALAKSGYTTAEIMEETGVSKSTIMEYIKE